jgi:hypothetical protein
MNFWVFKKTSVGWILLFKSKSNSGWNLFRNLEESPILLVQGLFLKFDRTFNLVPDTVLHISRQQNSWFFKANL